MSYYSPSSHQTTRNPQSANRPRIYSNMSEVVESDHENDNTAANHNYEGGKSDKKVKKEKKKKKKDKKPNEAKPKEVAPEAMASAVELDEKALERDDRTGQYQLINYTDLLNKRVQKAEDEEMYTGFRMNLNDVSLISEKDVKFKPN